MNHALRPTLSLRNFPFKFRERVVYGLHHRTRLWDHAVRKLRVSRTRFWLSTTNRRVGHAPVGAKPREREIDACQESFEVSRTLPFALKREHHLRERVNIYSEAIGLHL